MIENFFRKSEQLGVDYLLISGQATVLYGAATFSEDIDLWLNPVESNVRRFITALRNCGALYYKLTPPLSGEHLRRRHGFHFVIPETGSEVVFLDVMGFPPRVGSFASALKQSQKMRSAWGVIPTIGIRDLVELKKTQRIEDYPIISKLVRQWFRTRKARPTPRDYRWALENIFVAQEFGEFVQQHPDSLREVPVRDNSGRHKLGKRLIEGKEIPDSLVGKVERWMHARIQKLQQADRIYWRPIVSDLKQLRAANLLMPPLTRV
jgi:hypothetical protein